MIDITTVDAHVGGAPVRLITGGAPSPRGRSMRDKARWMARHADAVRTCLMGEPRGHRDMTGAMLTEPVSPGSHAGLIFMHGDGYMPMAGHAVMATTMLALSRGLLMPGGEGLGVTYDTAAGTVRARRLAEQRVVFANVPSFVLTGGIDVTATGRRVRVDVAFGGVFYAIVDAESLGTSVAFDQLPLLRRVGRDIATSINAALAVSHPIDPTLSGVAGTVFTAPASREGAHLRVLSVLADGVAGRAASGTGISAILPVLDAMGLVDEKTTVVFEGLSGANMLGRIAGRTRVGDYPALTIEVEGEAWPTGDHRFVVADADPFRHGLTFT
ncbi:MAG: proline racemase family protein [Vicinamibacterales bacterium]